MSQLEHELKSLRDEVIDMWNLVHSQLLKALSALLNSDKDLAREIVMIEKRVNGAELKIDRDCEDIFALYCPVAIDLRFLLAVLKINTNLERIGDIAEGIAKLIIDSERPFQEELFEATKIIEMFHESEQMIQQILTAFVQEDSSIARGIFGRDELLDDINRRANDLIIDYLEKYPQDIHQALSVLSIIRRLERVGDQAENIAEEIIFYIEAKVLKHTNKRIQE
ncbi:MAG TPA: phosphate signaling complex protein PhoU [Chitinophagaceae bacterium]|nr:phosphate signaling complex protein PhoU [Chitinophagaceae bacterium]